MVLVDIVWAMYIIYVDEKRALMASIMAVIIYLAGSYTTIKFVENKEFIAPALAGAFIGTFIAVRFIK